MNMPVIAMALIAIAAIQSAVAKGAQIPKDILDLSRLPNIVYFPDIRANPNRWTVLKGDDSVLKRSRPMRGIFSSVPNDALTSRTKRIGVLTAFKVTNGGRDGNVECIKLVVRDGIIGVNAKGNEHRVILVRDALAMLKHLQAAPVPDVPPRR